MVVPFSHECLGWDCTRPSMLSTVVGGFGIVLSGRPDDTFLDQALSVSYDWRLESALVFQIN